MSTFIGIVIISTVLLSSLVFLVVCLLMAESMFAGEHTPRVTEWFLHRLHETQRHSASRHS